MTLHYNLSYLFPIHFGPADEGGMFFDFLLAGSSVSETCNIRLNFLILVHSMDIFL